MLVCRQIVWVACVRIARRKNMWAHAMRVVADLLKYATGASSDVFVIATSRITALLASVNWVASASMPPYHQALWHLFKILSSLTLTDKTRAEHLNAPVTLRLIGDTDCQPPWLCSIRDGQGAFSSLSYDLENIRAKSSTASLMQVIWKSDLSQDCASYMDAKEYIDFSPKVVFDGWEGCYVAM